VSDLLDFAVGSAEVDVGQDDGAVAEDRFFHFGGGEGATPPEAWSI
jgi:hypothetical protein